MTSSLTAADVAAMVELTEGAAYLDMYRATPSRFRMTADETAAGITLRAPQFDVLILNRSLALGVKAAATQTQIAELVQRFRSEGTKNFGMQVGPAAQPAALSAWLGELGLAVRHGWSKVYRPAGPTPHVSTDLRLEAIVESEAEQFGLLACQGFGMPRILAPVMGAAVGRPGWRHYMAWDGDAPAAVAALYVHGHVGWLGVAATLPAMRRRGAQGALMARRIRDGAALGCRWFATETGQERPDKPNPSFHNMMRTGFTVAYHRSNFMQPLE